MKKPMLYAGLVWLALFGGCASKSELESKKETLKEKKKALREVKREISALESELDELDENWRGMAPSKVLVRVKTLRPQKFEHRISARASIRSRQHIDVLAEAMGRVLRVDVTEGQQVRQGQPLLSVDSEPLRYGLKELSTALGLAKKLYDKRSALWGQNIGSEIDYLKAKSDYEALAAKKKQLLAQLKLAKVTAPFAGTVDQLYVNRGQVVQPGVPVLRLVDNKDVFLEAEVADGYVGKFRVGDPIHVSFPTIGESLDTKISSVGKVIDPVNRTFVLEAKLPSGSENLQPNLLATVQLTDLSVESALVVPTRAVQRDNRGLYVYVAQVKGPDTVAVKRHVVAASDYKGRTYVSEGLRPDESVIVEGFRQLAPESVVQVVQ